MMPLLAGHIGEHDRTFARRMAAFALTRRWCGHMAFGGKGEILIALGED